MLKFKKILKWTGISAFTLLILIMLYLNFFNYSTGFIAGVPLKLDKKGYIFKTYEGTLNIDGQKENQDATGQRTWDFTVKKSADSVVARLEKAVLDGKRVKLYYNEKIVQFSWNGDTKYFVYDIETIKLLPDSTKQ